LIGLMAGAVITTLFFLDEALWIPIVVLLVSGLIAWGRWPQTKALAGAPKR
jgi:uncharacterized membrane protein YccC